MPAAARTPACRIPPPRILRARRASAMKAFDPQITEPTGAASPLDRQKLSESTDTGQFLHIHAQRNSGVEEPGPVEVDAQIRDGGPTAATAAMYCGVSGAP